MARREEALRKLLVLAVAVCTVAVIPISACRASLPERLPRMEKWQVCELFATYTFKGASKYLLATLDEIRRRGLEEDSDCKLVYEARMAALSRGDVNKRIDWALAIGIAAVLIR